MPYSTRSFEPHWDSNETDAVYKALQQSMLNEGKYVREFEEKFAEFTHARYCVLVPNGAIALFMAIKVWLGKESQGRIAVPDYYGIFAANAIRMLGKNVAIIDLNNRFTTDLLSQTVPVHINGRKANAVEIEDSCQAIHHHTPGALSCHSFHPSKLITCGGIGGAICCDNLEQYLQLSALKDHGRAERAQGLPISDKHQGIGLNFKMSDINAAFGIEQLKKLPARLHRLRASYQIYQEILGDKVDWILGAPSWRVDCLVQSPDMLIQSLAKEGFTAKRFYLPVHRQPQYLEPDTGFANTMKLYSHGIYLPSLLDVTEEDIQKICGIVLTHYNR